MEGQELRQEVEVLKKSMGILQMEMGNATSAVILLKILGKLEEISNKIQIPKVEEEKPKVTKKV